MLGNFKDMEAMHIDNSNLPLSFTNKILSDFVFITFVFDKILILLKI
jgi:hypothetical protein